MSMDIGTFTNDITRISETFKWYSGNKTTELNAIATALGTDTTVHDKTIEAAPAGLQFGNAANTSFTNAVLREVNLGKAGNLTTAAMASAITGGTLLPPANTAAPVASGTGTVGQTLSVTNGTWSNSPTEYSYQWLNSISGAIAGATSNTYVLQSTDHASNVSCEVTAINAVGSATTTSNAIAVT